MPADEKINPAAPQAIIVDWFGLKPPNGLAEVMLADFEKLAAQFADLPTPDMFEIPEPFAQVLLSLQAER